MHVGQVYQPLDPEFATRFYPVLKAAAKIAKEELRRKHPRSLGHIAVHKLMGITYLQKWQVSEVIAQGSLSAEWTVAASMTRFQDFFPHSDNDSPLEVPLDKLDWFGDERRKLVAKFPASGRSRLRTNTRVVNHWILDALPDIAGLIEAEQPNHCSFASCLGRRLDVEDRHLVEDVVTGYLSEAGFNSILLGSVIVGDTYNQPKICQEQPSICG